MSCVHFSLELGFWRNVRFQVSTEWLQEVSTVTRIGNQGEEMWPIGSFTVIFKVT